MTQFSNNILNFFRLNTSAVLALPLLDSLFDSDDYFFAAHCFDCGLVNTYLDSKADVIILRFDANNETIKDSVFITEIVSHNNTRLLYADDDNKIIEIKFPDFWHLDLQCIRDNNYKKLSDAYFQHFDKQMFRYVNQNTSELGNLYTIYAIPICVLRKCPSLYDILSDELGANIEQTKMLLKPYNAHMEKFNMTNLSFI